MTYYKNIREHKNPILNLHKNLSRNFEVLTTYLFFQLF